MADFDFAGMYGVQTPEIHAYACPNCGSRYYPAPMICAKCSNRRDPSGVVHSDWEKSPLQGPCRLLTWTRVWALPEGYNRPSLNFGMVEFENGLRASGRLEVEEPLIGMRLVARVAESSDRAGPPVKVFEFVPE
jgi:uncharacterized protein